MRLFLFISIPKKGLSLCYVINHPNMSRIIRTGLIQEQWIPDVQANRLRISQRVRDCAQKGAQLVVLQELHDGPYFCQTENVDNFNLAVTIPGPETDFYASLAKELNLVLVTSLFEKRAPGLYHNTAVVFETDGQIAGRYRKMHIPDDPAYYEKFYFTPGDLGFEPIQTSLGKLGVLVCWDQWYPEAARMMALKGADLLIYPTAIGWESSDTTEERSRQQDAWVTVQRGHAIANGLPLIAVNRIGHEVDPSGQTNGIQFWGHSFVAGPQGELLALASDNKPASILVDIDLTRSESVRRWWPFLRDRRIDAYDLSKRFLDDNQ
jgi:N-carbamoylputrescine amidase